MTHHAQILIVDDQPRARQGLRSLLSTWPFAAEIRRAVDGQEAVQLVEERQLDVELRMSACPRWTACRQPSLPRPAGHR
jgi:CheY-like chemotaxis protein